MKTPYEEFLEFVTNRPSGLKSSDPAICPYCHSTFLKAGGESSTLLGGGDGTPDGDPNHRQGDFSCKTCSENFVRHRKYSNVWYTDRASHVIMGMPSCFETFIYTHTCGGRITKKYKIDGKIPEEGEYTALKIGPNGKKNYVNVYTCDKCNAELESDFDYWHG